MMFPMVVFCARWPKCVCLKSAARWTPGNHGFWSGEDQGRYLVCLAPDAKAGFEKAAADRASATQIGTTGGTELTIAGAMTISLEEIARAHENWFPNLMGGR